MRRSDRMARRRTGVTWEPMEARTLMSAGDHLGITRQILWAVANHPVGDPVSPTSQFQYQALGVAVFDGGGAFDAGYTGNVTVALTGSNPGTMTGTLTQPAVGGYAEFGDLTFSAAGTYTVTASDDAGDPVDQTTVVVQPATTRCQIAVVSGPTLDAKTGTFSLTVAIEDANGNVVPNDEDNPALGSAGPADLMIASGPDGATVWSGNTGGVDPLATINPDGTQTFSNVKVSAAGTYTFDASDATPICGVVTGSIDLPATAVPAQPTPTPVPVLPPSSPGLVGVTVPVGVIGTLEGSPTFGATSTTPAQKRAAHRAAVEAAHQAKVAAREAAHAAKLAAREAKLAAHKAALAERTHSAVTDG